LRIDFQGALLYHAGVKRCLKLIFLILCFAGVARFCKNQTDGFTIERISSRGEFREVWETEPPAEAETLLSQKFHYLAKGAQSFVFASDDGETVLKLFRHHHMRAPGWLKMIPFKTFQERCRKLDAKLGKDFSSYVIAFQDLKSETGLLYLHLNPTSNLKNPIRIVDKLGIEHLLDPNTTTFLVQKRAAPLYPSLDMLAKQGDMAGARDVLDGLIQLLIKRSECGIFDKDPDLNTNFGVIDTKPLQIDIGRFRRDLNRKNKAVYKDDIIRITDNLHQWLMINYPELDDYFRGKLHEI
jgi:hypothetical protein